MNYCHQDTKALSFTKNQESHLFTFPVIRNSHLVSRNSYLVTCSVFGSSSKFVFFIIILIVFTIVNCSRAPHKIPDDIIPVDSMVSLLVDIQITDAAIRISRLRKDSISILYNRILLEHTFSRERFEKSFTFYTGNPDIMEKIYDEVINEISRRQAELVKVKTNSK